MSASFGPRRKAKLISQEDAPTDEVDGQDTGPVVKRPTKAKSRPSRVSFAPEAEEAEEGSVSVIKPKRGFGRRQAGPSRNIAADRLPVRAVDDEDRPSYSKESLAELKSAQQGRPAEVREDAAPQERELDIANKFGTTLASHEKREQSSLIPTDAEIREKKERRARLAKLAKYNIQSDDSDDASDAERHEQPVSDEDEFLTLRDKINLRDAREVQTKEPDTRLVRDDEDLMEGFETFTGEDTRVALGKGALQQAHAKQRAHIQDMIDAAQQESEDEEDGDGDDDEHDMRNEYEAMQTRKGMESLRVDGDGYRRQHAREEARTPPRITPIPTLSAYVEKLRGKLLGMEADRAAKLRRMEELHAEKKDIAQREVDIQKLLAETAAKYEKLSQEAGSNIELPSNGALGGLLLEGQSGMATEST